MLFYGCGTNYYEPELGEKIVAILEHNGFRVTLPKQGCCGLPLQSNGLRASWWRGVERRHWSGSARSPGAAASGARMPVARRRQDAGRRGTLIG